jgi:hypothetical protein
MLTALDEILCIYNNYDEDLHAYRDMYGILYMRNRQKKDRGRIITLFMYLCL